MAYYRPTQEDSSSAEPMYTTHIRPLRNARFRRTTDRLAYDQRRRNFHMLCGLVNAVGLAVALCLIPSVTAPYIGAALIADNSQLGPVSHAAFWGSLIVGPFAGLAGYAIYRHPNMPGLRDFWGDATLRERMWIGADLMAVLAFLSTVVGIATAPGRFSSNALVVVCLGGEAGWALIRICVFCGVLAGAL